MSVKIIQSVPFSTLYPVVHIESETSFGCKVLHIEGFAKVIDDPTDNLPPVIHADIDIILCGQEDLKPTLEILGGMDKVQSHANDHAETLFK